MVSGGAVRILEDKVLVYGMTWGGGVDGYSRFAPPALKTFIPGVIRVHYEQTVVLAADLVVENLADGATLSDTVEGALVTIPAGRQVQSVLLHFEPSTAGGSAAGWVDFQNREILGILGRGTPFPTLLSATDAIFGWPGVNYAVHGATRRWFDGDTVHRLGGRLDLTCGTAGANVDQLRIILAMNSVP